MHPVIIKEFTESEFKCKCGECQMGYEQMQQSTLYKLFTARKRCKHKFIIRSAVRCPNWNMLRGGKNNSSHLRGYAVDIAFTDMESAFDILKALLDAGFQRVGVNWTSGFIHVDDDPTLPRGLFRY
jgi:uncharacterized protein YcbK (DUF882 family)